MKKPELQKAIAQTLFNNQNGMSAAELATAIDLAYARVFVELKVMCEVGTVEKVDKTYVISDFGIASYGFLHQKSPLTQIEEMPVETVEPAPPVTESALEQNLNAAAREIVRKFIEPKIPTTLGDDGECDVPRNTAEKIDQPVDDLKMCRGFQEKHMKKPVVRDSRISGDEPRINPNQAAALHDFESKLHDDCSFAKPYPAIPINEMSERQINRHLNGTVPTADPGEHYRFMYQGIKLDPFRIAAIYEIDDAAQFTIVKKALCMGRRGYKDREQDLKDIICAAQRTLEMMVEDKKVGGRYETHLR